MKVIETHALLLKEAVNFAKKRKVSLSYGQLQGILGKSVVRGNTFIVPGTYPKNTQYLRFLKAKRGCIVEVCEVSY